LLQLEWLDFTRQIEVLDREINKIEQFVDAVILAKPFETKY